MARQESFTLSGKVEFDSKDATKQVEDLNEGVQETEESVKDLEKASKSQSKQTQKSAKKSSKAVRGIGKAARGAGKGFKLMGAALKGLGIGLIIAAVAKLSEAMSRNQKTVDIISKGFETVSIVLNEVITAVTNAFTAVSELEGGFKNSIAVISGLITLALTPFKIAIDGLKLGILMAKRAYEDSPLGSGDPKEIKALTEEIEKTKKSLKETGGDAKKAGQDIADNFGGMMAEMGDLYLEVEKNVSKINTDSAQKSADALVELRKQAKLAQSEVDRISLLNKRDAEIQRQRRDDTRLSIDERIKANEKLGEILEDSLKAQEKAQKKQVELAKAELALNPENIDAQLKLQEAKNGLLSIEEEIEGFRSEQRMNEATLQQERKENMKELQMLGGSELERQKIESQQELDRQKKLIKKTIKDKEEQNRRIEAAEKRHKKRIKQFEKEQKQEEAEKRIEELEAKRERDFQNAEAEFKFLKAQKERIKNMEVLTEKQKAEQLMKVNSQLAKAKDEKSKLSTKIAKIQNSEEYDAAKSTLQGIGKLVGEQAKANKLIGGAEALINTFKGVAQVWSSESVLPQPFATAQKIVATGTTLASGLKAVQKINSTSIPNVPGGSGGGTPTASGGIGGASAGQASAPDFNIVGQSQGNQIADAIGNQNQNMRAYVVGSEVSNQQELDRQIEEPSRLG